MNSVKTKIWKQVINQHGDKIWEQDSGEVTAQVLEQVEIQVYDQVRREVLERVEDQVWDTIWRELQ
jgi:ribosome maturation protein Sdo1